LTDFGGLLRALIEEDVAFILVGGVAAVAHGSSRATVDLDLVYQRTPENIARLVAATKDLRPYLRGAPAGLPFQWDPQTVKAGLNFTLSTTLGDLDLLGEISGGGGYQELLPHTTLLEVYGSKVVCLDLPTLIRVKRAAGRPKDLESIAILSALLEERGKSSGP
jgi:hypothetical protein